MIEKQGRKIHALVKHRDGYIVFKRRDGGYDLPHDFRQDGEERHEALNRFLNEQLHIATRLKRYLGTARNEHTGEDEHYYLVEALGEKFYLEEDVKEDKGYVNVIATTAEQIIRVEGGYLPPQIVAVLNEDNRFSSLKPKKH